MKVTDLEQVATDKASNAEDKVLEKVCAILNGYESRITVWLAELTAAICGVDAKAMLSRNGTHPVAQARWLYWYAYRYVFNATYAEIGRQATYYSKRRHSAQNVASSIQKISLMIEQEPLWTHRWNVLKKILKTATKETAKAKWKEDATVEVRIIAPANVKIETITETTNN